MPHTHSAKAEDKATEKGAKTEDKAKCKGDDGESGADGGSESKGDDDESGASGGEFGDDLEEFPQFEIEGIAAEQVQREHGKVMRCFCAVCPKEGGIIKYAVKWRGYESKHNTWEPVAHIPDSHVQTWKSHVTQKRGALRSMYRI